MRIGQGIDVHAFGPGDHVVLAGVRVAHAQGSSSRHRPFFVARHKRRSLWRYFCRHDPAARHRLLRAIVWLGLWLQFLLKVPLLGWRWMNRGR
jgi:GT2 family glycosyltransferase